MANKYDIIHIDFQASARGANAAIESIRKEAETSSSKINQLKQDIDNAMKSGAANEVINGLRAQQKAEEKRFNQLKQAQNELIKGMRVLDEGVKQFNSGALAQMNAAFQKSVNNAAKLAQSKMATGTKEWREMGAIMQETEQNYARMQRDTDQLIQNLQNGGTVFRKTLEDEKKGLNDLLQVLPYMGTEYRKVEEQLQILVKTTDEMAIKERQLKGEIVTTDDARRVRLHLLEDENTAARKAAEAAQVEIDKGKQQIETLEKEQAAIEARAKASASAAAKYTEDLQMYDDYIEELDREIDKDKKAAKARKEKAEQLRAEANSAKEAAEKQREAQKIVDQAYDETAAKVENLKQQLNDLKSGQQQATESTEKQSEAKKEEVKVEEQVVETQKAENVTVEQLTAAIDQQKIELEKLEAEKKAIIAAQEESARATNAEAEAYKNLTKEQAEAKLKEKQALSTFKNEGGKWQVSNREEAQQYLFKALGEIEPANVGQSRLQITSTDQAPGDEKISQLLSKFKERYGMKSDDDAMGAIRELMSGGLVKNGFMNKFLLNLEQDTDKIKSFSNEIKALTDIINADTKATEKNAEKKRTLEEVEADIKKVEDEKTANVKLLRKLNDGQIKSTEESTKKTNEDTEAKKKNVEATNAEIEAIRKLNKEQATAMLNNMRNPSEVDYKAGKLDASNIEEVQSFIVSRMKKIEPRNKKGDQLSLDGEQVTKLIKDIQERYGMIGSPKKAKDLLKQFVQGTDGGLFKSGGEADFSGYNKIIVNLDSDAYEARLAKLKELVKITSDTTQATDKLSEATKKGTEASKDSAKASEGQTDAINKQIEEINRRFEAYDAANKEYEKKVAELDRLKKAKSNLPKSGTDALLQSKQLDEQIKDYNENVVSSARKEKNRLKKLWEGSAQKLAEMQGIEQEAPKKTRKKIQSTKEDTQATEENTQATERNTKAKKDSAKASEEDTARKQKEAEIKKQLADAEKELTDAEKKKREEERKTTKADRDAETLEGKARKAEGEAGGKAEEYLQEQEKMKKEREQLMADNKDTLKNNEENQKQLADINEKLKEQTDRIRENEQIKAQANTEGIEKTEQAIRLLQEENRHIDTNSDKWKQNTADIQALQEALDEMKGKATLQMMTERMDDLGKLSNSAFEETRRFWQAMEQGADKGSDKLKEAQENVKKLADEERKRNEEQAGKVIGEMGSYSDKEIAAAVKTFEQMRDSLARTDDKWNEFNEQAQKGTEYLEQMKKQDALEKMEERMSHLSTLSDAARAETKKFFEALQAGAEKGSEDLRKAEDALRDIKNLEKDRNQEKADILLYGTLGNYSENEIREAIEAAKAFRNELATGDKDAERYAEAIAKAEAHIKKYGVETARAAQKQKENDDLMRAQLTRMFSDMYTGAGMPSESQLKAQKQYWQRLIDDPKTAASSLREYQYALADVEKIEADMVKIGGQTALAWFGQGSDKNASENQIKEMAAKLKEYRGTLLKETNADELAQIDAILQKVGQSAKKAAEDVMSLDDALKLAEGAGKDGFLASPQQIHQATKALNDRRDAVIKLIQENKALRLSTEAEEDELADLTKKLRDLKFEQDNYNMSQEKMRLLMETPTKAVNLEELREAIKRADAELHRMEDSLGDNSDEFKRFAAQVKEAKNVLKNMEGQAKATSSVWEKAWSRLKTYVGMYMGFNMAWQRVTGSVDDLMTLSDKMGEVRKTTGFTTEEVGRLSENLKKLDVRTPLDQLMEISAKAGQLGLKSQEDVQGFTEAANKLMIALPEMGTEAATEMMKVAIATGEVKKIQDQMNKGLIDGSSATEVALSKVGSTIDQLRANSAASAPAITDFVKRVGAVGAQSGITIDQVAALGATVDALGMRVEMSATALSRMIPAIRNNAFQVANAIGMAPNALRAMFDEAGGGMEAMLAIFQHIKDSGMDADSIEKLLGMGGLKDVMKELNQQGARAGIVFAGLSQNVDELRRNLVTARDAYEDNIAILQEYNKMNDTTAAKWERFKNQIEELFVGNNAQRWLGYFIDGLRNIFELLTGNNGVAAVVRTIVVYLGFVKANLFALITSTKAWSLNLSKIAVTLGFIDKETKKLQWGNIFTALAAAALWAWHEIAMLKSALDKAHESLGKTREEIGHSIERFEGYWVRLEATSSALQKARASHESLSAEVDKLRKTTDGSAESTAELKKKEDELTNSEKNVTRASNDHKSAISQMNSIYGKYLGFILTETNYTNLAAAAHEKVASAIEREMLLKQRQAAIGEVDSNYSQNIAEGYGDLNERLVSYGKLDRRDAARAMSDMQRFMRENLKYDETTNKTVVSGSVIKQLTKAGFDVRNAEANEIAALWFDQYLKNNYHLSDRLRRGITGVERRSDNGERWANVRTPFSTNFRADYASTYAQRERDRGAVSAVYGVDISQSEEREAKAAGDLLKKLEATAKNAKNTILNKNTSDVDRNKAYGELANALEGLENRINELNPQKDAATINRLNDMATALKGEGIDIKKLKQAREKIHQTLFERATFNEEDIENLNTTNPWGSSHEASSTDWKNMTAEQLVERRKQMNEFVKAIQTDSDVQSVLAEDSALKAAIEKGMSSDMRTVINWYNTERLKIQDELHARYLTNTGAWKDPKQSRARRKRLQDDMKAYLEELDAYYTERKSRIDEARNDEEISEAEAWNRNIKNEAEWHRRRAELQIMYSKRAKEITAEEQQAIAEIIAERTGDDAKFIKATIDKTVKFSEAIRDMNEQGAKEYRKFQGDLDLGSEKDYNKVEKALGKHLKAMEDIINKERPFNGIVDSLQDNLGKMGILTADLGDDAKSAADELVRLTFLMGEAEKAYTMTVDQLLEDMRQHGFKEWGDAISKDPNMQQGLLAMLRQTFDSVQDAIKKESGIIKKHVENMLLDVTEAAQAEDTRLQILQNSVSRANSLIGAGAASERVADKLAIKQIQLQITLQETRIRMLQKRGADAVALLKQEAALQEKLGNLEKAKQMRMDAQNIDKSVGLTLTKEQIELDKQRVSLAEKLEESQNRLYTTLREWATLLSSSVQSLMEASNAGNAEYYNELAKLNLTGKGGPGAGTYIVIDNEGTSNAEAHYEHLTEREALERQHEIERQNAQAEAWRKVMDDINAKMNEQITDWMNAYLQNASIDMNTTAVDANTVAISGLTEQLSQGIKLNTEGAGGATDTGTEFTNDKQANYPGFTEQPETQSTSFESTGDFAGDKMMYYQQVSEAAQMAAQAEIDASNQVRDTIISNTQQQTQVSLQGNKKIQTGTQSAFAKMTAAANLYGIAYQAMSNDNLSTTQKFEMIAVQAAGQAAISALTASLAQNTGQVAADTPAVASKTFAQLGPIGGAAAFAAITALLGGLLGFAVSKIAKSKSQIAQATGASASAGRLATGMMTYAEGNVNEFTNPASLTPGRSYNVDAADGKTYRAKYTGKNPSTHLTNGPEFHLAGEKGREMIIDAGTTRQITMNENEIWRTIKTLSGGGRIASSRRRGKGVRAFAEGNVDEFDSVVKDDLTTDLGFDPVAMKDSIDKNNELLERALTEGIKGVFDVYGPNGLVSSYDKGKKNATRHGERY